MKTIIFAPETINIAETTRMVEIAKHCKEFYHCVFVGYSDEYAIIILDNGFEYRPLNPQLTREKTEHLWKVDRMESFADPFTYQELDERVKSEVEIIKGTNAAAIVMGFSANRKILKQVIEALGEIKVYVICPMKKHLEQIKVDVPKNVYITDWLPAHLVNPMAKISVIHGGQGTVQTAVESATPFIGVGLQPEQVANIDMVVNQGCARRIPKYEVSKLRLKSEIEYLLNDPKAYVKATELAQLAKSYNSLELVLSKIKEIVG